jgi:ribosomal protein S18 acetylase RimI-like enzyme
MLESQSPNNEDNTVIGLGRIAGDGGLYYFNQNLIVAPNFQSKGVGTSLLNELMNYIKTVAKPGSFIGLLAEPYIVSV